MASFLTMVEFGEGPPEKSDSALGGAGNHLPGLYFDVESGMFFFRETGMDWQAVPSAADAKAKADKNAAAKKKAAADAEKARKHAVDENNARKAAPKKVEPAEVIAPEVVNPEPSEVEPDFNQPVNQPVNGKTDVNSFVPGFDQPPDPNEHQIVTNP